MKAGQHRRSNCECCSDVNTEQNSTGKRIRDLLNRKIQIRLIYRGRKAVRNTKMRKKCNFTIALVSTHTSFYPFLRIQNIYSLSLYLSAWSDVFRRKHGSFRSDIVYNGIAATYWIVITSSSQSYYYYYYYYFVLHWSKIDFRLTGNTYFAKKEKQTKFAATVEIIIIKKN